MSISVPATDPDVRTLREEVEFLRDVLRCLPVGLIVADAQSRIVLSNPLADGVRQVGDRIGETLAGCHPERAQGPLRRVLARLRESPTGRPHPIVVERGSRWRILYSRITDEHGTFRGVAWGAWPRAWAMR